MPKYQKHFAKKGVGSMFCNAKQARHRALLADVAYWQATAFAVQTWSAVPRSTLIFGGCTMRYPLNHAYFSKKAKQVQ